MGRPGGARALAIGEEVEEAAEKSVAVEDAKGMEEENDSEVREEKVGEGGEEEKEEAAEEDKEGDDAHPMVADSEEAADEVMKECDGEEELHGETDAARAIHDEDRDEDTHGGDSV